MFNIFVAKCTATDPSWKNLSITGPELPVKHGETVQLKCRRKHTNRGCSEMIATCQNGVLDLTSCLTNSGCVKTGTNSTNKYRIRESRSDVSRNGPQQN